MARAIDAYTLNNDLVSWYNDTEDEKEKSILRRVMQRVVQAPTLTPPNEWVSVEDRLPPDMGDVLVAAFWHERWQTMIGWHSDSRKGSWRVYTSHGEVVPGGVTHWMPLPEPPDRRPPEGDENA